MEYKMKLQSYLMGGMVCSAMALGRKLNLFEALDTVSTPESPAFPADVALQANCKERYVREWLCCMGCADVIEITPEEKFFMTEEQRKELVGSKNFVVAQSEFLPEMMKPFEELVDVFRADSGKCGLSYSQFSNFYHLMDKVTTAMHGEHLIPRYMPLIGMADPLSAGGIQALDVGCGSCFHALSMAQAYPKSSFTATDISVDGIALGKKRQTELGGVPNLDLQVMDAGKMNPEWTNKFDFITIFDACHDQMRPDLCLKEIYRMLKPGGTFAMLEVNGTSNAYEDKHTPGVLPFMYAISMFHCLPVGSNSPDALCLGATWGKRRAGELLADAGFKPENVKILNPPYFPLNIVYLCTKPMNEGKL